MTLTLDDTDVTGAPDISASPTRPQRALARPGLKIAGVASICAGAIHAAAVGPHTEHPQAAEVFTLVAAVQIVWGVLALTRPSRALAIMMGGGNLLCVGAWIMAKRSGISFINGLEIPEPVQFADGACAALAEVSFLASAAYLLVRAPLPRRPILGGALVVLIAGMGLPGMLAAGRHVHSHGTTVVVGADGKAVETTAAPVVPPHPFDPSLPIDLSGVPGVTPQEQARAENLVAVTLYKLPQWADTKTAIAAGFQSIGDAVTGYEHYINQAYFDDGHVLDPDHPESLVYRVDGDKRILESAMYMLTPGTSLDNVPDIGGPLTQWHIHDNLCFSTSGQVVGLTNPDGSCAPPLVKPEPIPMIHVWIVPRVCGPFAALEGIGGGTVKPGTAVSCDHVHGSGTGF